MASNELYIVIDAKFWLAIIRDIQRTYWIWEHRN